MTLWIGIVIGIIIGAVAVVWLCKRAFENAVGRWFGW